jgi:hypothetical protein
MKLQDMVYWEYVEELHEFWDELGCPPDAWNGQAAYPLVAMFGLDVCMTAMTECVDVESLLRSGGEVLRVLVLQRVDQRLATEDVGEDGRAVYRRRLRAGSH